MVVEHEDATKIGEKIDSEPWVYDNVHRIYKIEGELADLIRKRSGLDGEVTMEDLESSNGTCGLCGSYGDELKVFVNNRLVFQNERSYGMDIYDEEERAKIPPTPYAAFEKWLRGDD